MNHPTSDVYSEPRKVTAPLPANLVMVPLVQQVQDFSCGAAATLLLMRYWCVGAYDGAAESDLYAPLRTTQARGTEPEPIVDLFRRSGLHAEYRTGSVQVDDLERAVAAGEPPVVDLQAWSDHDAPWRQTWDAGHYVVMVGYDTERLYFADPSRATPRGYAFLNRTELDDRWHDLSGDHDTLVERMTIFVRGSQRWLPQGHAPSYATKLG
jgi:ABC-type bacteriocin/lantibiotic exporter with double-glycine peptidase domain